jgi:hypothetical protein
VTRPPKDKVIRLKRPSLPEKVVSKEIVASLSQFDEAEKTAWTATLTSKQTEELLKLMKDEEDERQPLHSGKQNVNGSHDVPRRPSESGQRAGQQDPPVAPSTLPAHTKAGSSANTPSNQKPEVPGADTPLTPPTAQAPAHPPVKAGANAASLPSPSVPAPPAKIPPASQKQDYSGNSLAKVPSVLPSTVPPVASPSATTASRPTLSSLYASISIPAPIPHPITPWLAPVRPKQPPHHLPLIRHFSFVYDLVAPQPDTPFSQSRTEWQNTIKLRNMRGITSHIVAISRTTRNIEITAFLEEGYYNLNPLAVGQHGEPIGHQNTTPIHDTLSYAPLPELSLECNGKTPKGELVHPGGDVSKRPVAHKWSFSVDPAIVNFVIEVHVRRAAELPEGNRTEVRPEVKETCMIFVNRQ